jgi:hypothetical protein
LPFSSHLLDLLFPLCLVSEKSQFVQALLEYEKHKREIGEIQLPVGSLHQPSSVEKEVCCSLFFFLCPFSRYLI